MMSLNTFGLPRTSAAILCGPALLLSVFAQSAIRADDKLILVKNREVLSGRIKKEDVDSVQIEVKDPRTGAPGIVTRNSAEILDIEWDVNDEDWHEGVAAFKRGNYSLAVQSFQNIVGTKE